jgi:hypothetical protein
MIESKADTVWELMDGGRGHTTERHGDVEETTLIARGTRLPTVTSWVRADDAFAALKELLHRDWGVQGLLRSIRSRRLVIDTGTDFNKTVKIKQVAGERGKHGYEAFEGDAKVSVVCVLDVAGEPVRADDSVVTLVTLYPTLREWEGKPKAF